MNEAISAPQQSGKNMSFLGVIAITLGILAMLAPGLTGVSIAMMVGWVVVLGGLVRMIWAFRAGSFGRGLLTFAIGGLTLACGIALVAHPLFSTGVLTIVLAIYFLADGLTEILAGFQARPTSGWGWLLFSGAVSILFGILIWRQFPLSGAWAIGILLGIKLFMIGLIMVTGGSALKSAADAPAADRG